MPAHLDDPGVPSGLFWFRARLTLASALSGQEVRERLSTTTPMLDPTTGGPAKWGGLIQQTYRITIKDRKFGFMGSRVVLGGTGVISENEQGSHIKLSVVNYAIFYAALIWISGLILGVGVATVKTDMAGALLTLLGFAAFFGVFGLIVQLWLWRQSRREFSLLVACFEKMFEARRRK